MHTYFWIYKYLATYEAILPKNCSLNFQKRGSCKTTPWGCIPQGSKIHTMGNTIGQTTSSLNKRIDG